MKKKESKRERGGRVRYELGKVQLFGQGGRCKARSREMRGEWGITDGDQELVRGRRRIEVAKAHHDNRWLRNAGAGGRKEESQALR